METTNVKIIDRQEIMWQTGKGQIALQKMEDDHLVKAYSYVLARLSDAEKAKKGVPEILQEHLFDYNGRSLQEWKEIFETEMNYRAKLIENTKEKEPDEMIQLAQLLQKIVGTSEK